MKILIVDDEEINRRLFSHLLMNEGYKLYTANNGKTGLTKVKEVQPDLIIMDMEMPVMTGYEAVWILRDQGYHGVIIACSATIESNKKLYSGCDRILSKPVNDDLLVETVKNLLSEVNIREQK